MINGLKIQCKSILPLLGGGGPKQGEDEQQEGKGHTVVTVTQEVMVAWGGGPGCLSCSDFRGNYPNYSFDLETCSKYCIRQKGVLALP